jgi:hypothetical protein
MLRGDKPAAAGEAALLQHQYCCVVITRAFVATP